MLKKSQFLRNTYSLFGDFKANTGNQTERPSLNKMINNNPTPKESFLGKSNKKIVSFHRKTSSLQLPSSTYEVENSEAKLEKYSSLSKNMFNFESIVGQGAFGKVWKV